MSCRCQEFLLPSLLSNVSPSCSTNPQWSVAFSCRNQDQQGSIPSEACGKWLKYLWVLLQVVLSERTHQCVLLVFWIVPAFQTSVCNDSSVLSSVLMVNAAFQFKIHQTSAWQKTIKMVNVPPILNFAILWIEKDTKRSINETIGCYCALLLLKYGTEESKKSNLWSICMWGTWFQLLTQRKDTYPVSKNVSHKISHSETWREFVIDSSHDLMGHDVVASS